MELSIPSDYRISGLADRFYLRDLRWINTFFLWREQLSLLCPDQRDFLRQPRQRKPARLCTLEDRLDEVCSKEGEAEDTAHVGTIELENGKLGDGSVVPLVDQLLPVVGWPRNRRLFLASIVRRLVRGFEGDILIACL